MKTLNLLTVDMVQERQGWSLLKNEYFRCHLDVLTELLRITLAVELQLNADDDLIEPIVRDVMGSCMIRLTPLMMASKFLNGYGTHSLLRPTLNQSRLPAFSPFPVSKSYSTGSPADSYVPVPQVIENGKRTLSVYSGLLGARDVDSVVSDGEKFRSILPEDPLDFLAVHAAKTILVSQHLSFQDTAFFWSFYSYVCNQKCREKSKFLPRVRISELFEITESVNSFSCSSRSVANSPAVPTTVMKSVFDDLGVLRVPEIEALVNTDGDTVDWDRLVLALTSSNIDDTILDRRLDSLNLTLLGDLTSLPPCLCSEHSTHPDSLIHLCLRFAPSRFNSTDICSAVSPCHVFLNNSPLILSDAMTEENVFEEASLELVPKCPEEDITKIEDIRNVEPESSSEYVLSGSDVAAGVTVALVNDFAYQAGSSMKRKESSDTSSITFDKHDLGQSVRRLDRTWIRKVLFHLHSFDHSFLCSGF